MTKFLAVQHTYTTVEFAVFENTNLIAFASEDKMHASKRFMAAIEDLLNSKNLSRADLSFIAANQGPGPFTTLRVVIASLNGIAYGSGIPLIGVDGLAVFLDEYAAPSSQSTVALLNAYNHDIYFGVQQAHKQSVGCAHAQTWLAHCARDVQGDVHFIGNAVALYRSDIQELFGTRAHIPSLIPDHPSLTAIAQHALAQWHKGEKTSQLFPLYLKQYSAVMPA